jgi:hypothetical protein
LIGQYTAQDPQRARSSSAHSAMSGYDTADYLDEHGCPLPAGALVYAVRTDLPPDRATWVAPRDHRAADRRDPTTPATRRPPASITSITDQRARRAGHPASSREPGQSGSTQPCGRARASIRSVMIRSTMIRSARSR